MGLYVLGIMLSVFLPRDLGMWAPLLALPFAIGATWLLAREDTKTTAKASAMVDEAQAWIDQLKANGKSPAPDTGSVIVPAGQVAILSEQSSLAEFRPDGRSSYLGTRVKIGSVPIYMGQSQRSARKVLQEIAHGQLILTDAGLLFVSTGKTLSIKLKDVVGVESTSDSIIVNSAQRVNPLMASVRNPILWSMVIRLFAEGGLTVKG